MKTLIVSCEWDPEAKVWFVVQSDVPGLVCEAETVEQMSEKLRERIPELLALNSNLSPAERSTVPWELIARRQEHIVGAC